MLKNYVIPTHMLIGVRKGATSWCWKQLRSHPDIQTPFQKEIYFFNQFYGKGLKWYARQFRRIKKVVIDTTPDYFNEICADRIKLHFPHMRMLVCLRNPIERAYSHFKFAYFIHNNRNNFKRLWKKNWCEIKTRGLYDIHLKVFHDRFPKNNLFVMFNDDIKKDSKNFVDNMLDYIGVKKVYDDYIDKRWMPGLNSYWRSIGNKKVENRYEEYKEYHKTRIMEDDDFKIMKDYYEESIFNLGKIVNRDLSHWLIRDNIEA